MWLRRAWGAAFVLSSGCFVSFEDHPSDGGGSPGASASSIVGASSGETQASSSGGSSVSASTSEGSSASQASVGGSSAGQGGTGGSGGVGGAEATSGSGGAGATGGGGSSAGGGDTGGGGGDASGGGGGAVDDPALDGPWEITSVEDTTTASDGSSSMPMFVAIPESGPGAGPYPVIVFAHGLSLAPTQYLSYMRRLASHGFLAASVGYPTPTISRTDEDDAQDLIAALDWIGETFPSAADTSNAGMSGHSLGGKLALLASSYDSRVAGAIVLDPVDQAQGCSGDCVDVSALMPIPIPTAFIGETTESASNGCVPAAQNYTTFFSGTDAPSLEVTAVDAVTTSFIDDRATCGVVCSLCATSGVDDDVVKSMTRAYMVAFYRRWLNGETGYDAYLTGAIADDRYVTPGIITIQSK